MTEAFKNRKKISRIFSEKMREGSFYAKKSYPQKENHFNVTHTEQEQETLHITSFGAERNPNLELEELGLTKKQIDTLKKRKIISAEALLRKQPLHYWNFETTYALDPDDPQTAKILSRRAPFAIIGTCVSCKSERKDHVNLVKLKIEDEKTKSTSGHGTYLYVNIMGSDAIRYKLLEERGHNPAARDIAYPNTIAPVCSAGLDVNPKCAKALQNINDEKQPRAAEIGSLKTFGTDGCSRITLFKLKEVCGEATFQFLLKYFGETERMPQLTTETLKWYARGLRLDLAIKKISIDRISLPSLLLQKRVIVGGFIGYNEEYNTFSVMSPPVLSCNIEKYNCFYVQHGQVKGFTPEEYVTCVDKALQNISAFDFMPADLLKKAGLPSFREASARMHHPRNFADINMSKKRAVFDDLMYLAVKLKLNQPDEITDAIPRMPAETRMQNYIHSLPYGLTNGQKTAIETIADRMTAGKTVSSLVQGDVGTGKTCVAFALLLKAAENGYQAALAAPYTTLAWQHYRDMSKIAAEQNINVVFLTSETKASEKKKIYEKIRTGEAQIIIGTHSIFSAAVEYQKLGLTILDEEHKFGVVHRGNLIEKGVSGCHKVTMSATPIPKSIAETIYGDTTGIITITDKPAERLPVKTAVTQSDKAAAKHMIKEIEAGHQAYIVCPAIDKNDKSGQMASIEEKEKVYRPFFDEEHITMAVLTGKMKADEKTQLMSDFAAGKIKVLMATTVIEVGMNVPNATVMTITGADRFGFSTLHQLRGRVGRGKDQAYCILQTDAPNDKLEFMKTTNDGFEIAEKDLELRGPGTLFGERQTGENYFINLMLAYPNMFQWIKKEAAKLCQTQTGKDIVRRYEKLFLSEEQR